MSNCAPFFLPTSPPELLNEHHTVGLNELAVGLHAVEVLPARHVGCVPVHLVHSGRKRLIHQRGHLAAQHVKHGHADMALIGHLKANRGRRIERIRVVGLEGKLRGHRIGCIRMGEHFGQIQGPDAPAMGSEDDFVVHDPDAPDADRGQAVVCVVPALAVVARFEESHVGAGPDDVGLLREDLDVIDLRVRKAIGASPIRGIGKAGQILPRLAVVGRAKEFRFSKH